MPMGKARSSKRSSGTSYSSTIISIIFMAFCIMVVYVVTPKSAVFPESATKTATTAVKKMTAGLSSIADTTKKKLINQNETRVFDDTEGNLPEDAIRSDVLDRGGNAGQIQRSKYDQKDGTAEIVKDLAGGENSQMASNIEAESNMNDKQEVTKDSIDDKKESSGMKSHQGDANSGDSKSNQRRVSDEDHSQRAEEHQREEEELMRQKAESVEETREAMSGDQIQHDAASTNMDEHQNNLEKTIESETRSGNQGNQEMFNELENELKTSSQSNEKRQISGGEGSGLPKESKESKKSWSTQAGESKNENERQKGESEDQNSPTDGQKWQLCNVTAGYDYIPCLDNEEAIAKLHSRKHYEHRERHCPEKPPTCLVPLPRGYKTHVEWPQSRDKIWYHNVPHTKLAEYKGHQNWVKVSGEFLTFPGGGTQFIHGALHYIDFIQEAVPDIAWGKNTRVVLDVGCGVASFGGYLFDRDVLTMSLAPKDEHEAQVQFALERGIPAISAVMGSQRLPFPSKVFDLVHCARCRVPWHAEGGALLLEINRLMRPGSYFVWSATPVYQRLKEDAMIWREMSTLTANMCWELVTIKKDKLNSIGAAIYHKPISNDCYRQRRRQRPPMCKKEDDPNAAWYVLLGNCMHNVPVNSNERGAKWPVQWPDRLQMPPYWLSKSQMGIHGKPAPDDFTEDYKYWKQILSKSYLNGLGISWSNVRNVMDMRATYGGFAAALKENKVWVMNVVNTDSPDTLPIIYDRGLFGIYHDWCESFSTYPRTYDLLHAHHLFSNLKKKCELVPVIVEVDRMLRPGGKFIVRDESSTLEEIEKLLRSLHWGIQMTYTKNKEGVLSAQKTDWRPQSM